MKKFLTMMAIVGLTSIAQADIKAPLWDCAMNFDVQGGGLQVLIGKYKLTGPGTLSCVDIKGNTQVIPLKVTVGSDVAVQVAFGRARMVGIATGIGLSANPESLLGNYYVGGATAALGVGAGAQVALHGADKALTLNANVQLIEGFGASFGLSKVKIERAN